MCSVHFHTNAFKKASWMQSILGVGYTLKKTRILRADAIPTEYLELSMNKGMNKGNT